MDDGEDFAGEVLAALDKEPVSLEVLQRRVGGTKAALLHALGALVAMGHVIVDGPPGRHRYRTHSGAEDDSAWGLAQAPRREYHSIVASALDELLRQDMSDEDGSEQPTEEGEPALGKPIANASEAAADDPLGGISDASLGDVPDVLELDTWRFGEDAVEPEAEPDAASDAEDSYWVYVSEVHSFRLLSHAEEIDAARRVRDGAVAKERVKRQGVERNSFDVRRLRQVIADGESARHVMILGNLRLVMSVARRYRAHGMSRLDMIQEGNLGLMRAVERFDHTLGYKFSTYATWWIRQAISRALNDKSRMIRLPVYVMESVNRLEHVRRRLVDEGHWEPTACELADALGSEWTPERVQAAQELAMEAISLEDFLVGSGVEIDEQPLLVPECEMPESLYEVRELRERVLDMLNTLPERDAFVLRHRFGISVDERTYTLEEVGVLLDLTRERIRQIEKRALKALGVLARIKVAELLDV